MIDFFPSLCQRKLTENKRRIMEFSIVPVSITSANIVQNRAAYSKNYAAFFSNKNRLVNVYRPNETQKNVRFAKTVALPLDESQFSTNASVQRMHRLSRMCITARVGWSLLRNLDSSTGLTAEVS